MAFPVDWALHSENQSDLLSLGFFANVNKNKIQCQVKELFFLSFFLFVFICLFVLFCLSVCLFFPFLSS